MEESEKRPRANVKPPDLDADKKTLEYLLEVEKKRLEVAVRIETERNIVFPETTVIIRDIQKLMNAINKDLSEKKTEKKDEFDFDF